MPNRVPPLVLTCGEPAGIAAEITAKAWMTLRGDANKCFFLLGDAFDFEIRAKAAGCSIPIKKIASAEDASRIFSDALPVMHRPLPVPSQAGKIEPQNSAVVIEVVREAARL